MYSEHGWLIDDISVPEIGFFDNLESGNKNWSTDLWLHNVIYMNDSSNITPIYMDFVIPDNYTSDASDQKVIAMEISGADGNYNPTQTAVPYVVARLPPLVKVIPAPPSGGGGGGSGTYYSRYGNEYSYFDNLIEPGTTSMIDTSTSNTPLLSLELLLISITRNVELRIIPLFSKPDEVKDSVAGVYSYFRIDAKNLDYSTIKKALLKVKVPSEWILSNAASPDNIVVSRLSGGTLQDLDTKRVGLSGNSYLYEATTPGFSIFVVRIKSQVGPNIVMPVNQTFNQNISRMKPLTIIAGNESPEKVVDDMKRLVRGKTGATKEEVDKFFEDKVLVIRKAKPELEKPLVSRILMYLSVVLFSAVFVALLTILMRMRKVERKGRKK
jgi:PGF-pre-PGF domain-containing protein